MGDCIIASAVHLTLPNKAAQDLSHSLCCGRTGAWIWNVDPCYGAQGSCESEILMESTPPLGTLISDRQTVSEG